MNTSWTVLFILAGLLSIMLVYQSTIAPPGSFIDKIINKTDSFSGVYVALGFFITAQIFFDQRADIQRRTTLRSIEKNFLGTFKLIMDNYDKCPSFCSSLFYSWQSPVNQNEDLKKNDDWKTVLLISIKLFQSIEDITTAGDTDITGLHSWVATFMPWFRSKQLKQMWDMLYPQFDRHTIDVCDYLFKTLNDTSEPINAENHYSQAIKIAESNTFKKIIQKF